MIRLGETERLDRLQHPGTERELLAPEKCGRVIPLQSEVTGLSRSRTGERPDIQPVAPPIVYFDQNEEVGSIIVDTQGKKLYYVLPDKKAYAYPISVGRDGFTWSGTQTISRKAEWPSWTPPAEMIARQPYLPRYMAGGPGNPMGARAMYLGNTVYRIHGTNDPSSIGRHVSSGCIRMNNEDVIDLYNRAGIGTKVIVLPASERRAGMQ